MARYVVRFFKALLSSDGHPFKCLQTQIDVMGAEDAAQAARWAAQAFEADHNIRDWQLHADTREVVAIEAPADAASGCSDDPHAVWSVRAVTRATQNGADRSHAARRR